MPEGHSIHRIAQQFNRHFVGDVIRASSPQGRFAAGARELDGRTMTEAKAVGKQLFLRFDEDRYLRVHLGLYGAWDFAGEVSAPRFEGSTVADDAEPSLSSIGAPRLTRLRMAEQEDERGLELAGFPPEPVGAVRVRLLTETSVADLRGPTACEVIGPDEVERQLAKLGPDPMVDRGRRGEDRFVANVRSRNVAIGQLLMDQSVVSGIGNVFRAELLFRARLNPHKPGREIPEDQLRELWRDWAKLLKRAVKVGQMLTMDGLSTARREKAIASQADRHWVYKRQGLPCRVCGTHILIEEMAGRNLYWCPKDQA
ncbi:Fpg/Nei family DNA glycosylase [Herbiconiux sp. SYSU D00978]|uniref:Fpg/Nei family DNA glycosylase n=1 Tax=Herbiconiux sp. SYSU D00978 TaxID=2812562 RepID=UPI001A956E3E|nr:DNA glycosylase [Herbiconiux sp. SYSU D00978]